jgi:uncharacterized protein YdeI (YjbR/CyaY-like superfamily)
MRAAREMRTGAPSTMTTRDKHKNALAEFKAPVDRHPGALAWVVAHIPFDVKRRWGSGGIVRVKGTINGFAFRTSVFPTGKGTHFLMVNKIMQKGARIVPGATAAFRLERDTAERKVEIPAELARALKQDRALRKYFDKLNFSTRADFARTVTEPKSAEARQRRADHIAERLLAAMLAEEGELPPVLQAAMRQHPKARQGWDLMPASHRRAHLLGISGYKSPESRAGRVQKAIEMMIDYAEKKDGAKSGRKSR